MKVQLCIPQADETDTWIMEIGQIKFGPAPQSGWHIQLRGNMRAIENPNDMIPLLPILEMDRDLIYSHLESVSKNSPKISSRVMEFPETLLLQCAFETSVSDYWPLKGLKWLKSAPNLSRHFEEILSALQKRSWATQALKQEIKSIQKSIRQQ
ncbi:hypothetical protein [Variovorax guangxiensis]|uniref:Uncharacterized protein n=1 Tax=Variovorax guangxiensis TaxID=1775474 RepID=A0A840FN11_9BURK|nr:hypothetical protein [Variovorax guangxiensis]MBB4223936.1 hypothetical protein [Variovorax guangxiensis]